MTRACRQEQSQSARLYLDCFSVFFVRVRHDLCVAPYRTVPSGSAQVRLRTAYAGALPIATSQPTRYQDCMFPTTSNLSFPVHIRPSLSVRHFANLRRRMAKGIFIGAPFRHIPRHCAIAFAKSAHDSEKDSERYPLR